jgi:hypothetical protein
MYNFYVRALVHNCIVWNAVSYEIQVRMSNVNDERGLGGAKAGGRRVKVRGAAEQQQKLQPHGASRERILVLHRFSQHAVHSTELT